MKLDMKVNASVFDRWGGLSISLVFWLRDSSPDPRPVAARGAGPGLEIADDRHFGGFRNVYTCAARCLVRRHGATNHLAIIALT
jgi:hypothetical protein